MASIIMRVCECGLPYQIYFPKATLYEWGLVRETKADLEHYQEIDRREVEAGEVDIAKFLSETFGCQFVDSREAEKYSCPGCQKETRLSDVLEKKKDLETER